MWQLQVGCEDPAHRQMGFVHCQACCLNDPTVAATGRWLYADDGRPVMWVPSDSELRDEALAGQSVFLEAAT